LVSTRLDHAVLVGAQLEHADLTDGDIVLPPI
jgi:uncharacterized protein YjbI with pentapeptide repeats